jgi:ATP-dependent DNA helicase RecG
MTQEALGFIERNFITETVIKYPDTAIATRVKNFPYAAIEEAVVNTVYHRDYTVREPIVIRIYQDEMLILSYPGPDRSVKLEALQKGRANSRRYRNRRIGKFLKELKMTEGRSTGINKILDAMAKNGSPKPEFDFDEEHTYFQVKLPAHVEVLKENGVSLDFIPQVTPQVKKLISILDKEMSRVEIMDVLRLEDRKNFKTLYLNPAIKSKLVELTIPDKPQSPKQKYQLTQLGQEILKEGI